jgi:SAM-dependent methyltransferase
MTDADFVGHIPEIYQTRLVPLLFEPYADDLAARVAALAPKRVLEIAAGTGVVTRALAKALPPDAEIVATDLNRPMLDRAARIGTARAVVWRHADAMALPFDDLSFDVVLCQFGVMFFPDKVKAHTEARRVLRGGGTYLFNTWDRLMENEFADEVEHAVAAMFPEDPPGFLGRTPYGYYERDLIAAHLRAAGFEGEPPITSMIARSVAASPREPAVALVEGTPLRNEVEARDASRLAEATETAARAVAKRFGPGPVDGKLQALIVEIARSSRAPNGGFD